MEIYDGCSSHVGLPEGIYYHHFFPMKQMGQWWLGYILFFLDKLISGEHVSKPAFKANKVGWGQIVISTLDTMVNSDIVITQQNRTIYRNNRENNDLQEHISQLFTKAGSMSLKGKLPGEVFEYLIYS